MESYKYLDFENKFGKTTRTTAWIKWCTDEKYRKRSIDFNQSIARTMKSMNPIELKGKSKKVQNWIFDAKN